MFIVFMNGMGVKVQGLNRAGSESFKHFPSRETCTSFVKAAIGRSSESTGCQAMGEGIPQEKIHKNN